MNTLVSLSYVGLIAMQLISSVMLVPINMNLIVTTTCIVYIGCHRSLRQFAVTDDGKPKNDDVEIMKAKDAYMFPVFGSAALVSLYVSFKLFGQDAVNQLLAVYFGLAGTLAMGNFFDNFVKRFFGEQTPYKFSYTIPYFVKERQDVEVTNSELVSCLIASGFTGAYFYTRHHLLNNLFGTVFCLEGIAEISLGSYQTGAILLVGLFLYDIFWVFGTDVMVTVAKGFDAPIKLLFVKAFATDEDKTQYSLLGLGDIVIPGIFIAMILRYDLTQARLKQSAVDVSDTQHANFPKPIFHSCMVGYILGLFTTVAIMFYFDAAQPALLYLVPACLIFSFVPALVRGEMNTLVNYSEEKEEEKKEEKEGEAKKEK